MLNNTLNLKEFFKKDSRSQSYNTINRVSLNNP